MKEAESVDIDREKEQQKMSPVVSWSGFRKRKRET